MFGTEYSSSVMQRRTSLCDGKRTGLGLHSCSVRSYKKSLLRILDL